MTETGRLANIRLKAIDQSEIWRRTSNFLESYDSKQISHVPDQFKALVTEFITEAGRVCTVPIMSDWAL